jgi:predicted phosphohydrolase
MIKIYRYVPILSALLACFIFSCSLVSGQTQGKIVTGAVFEDKNRNSQLDAGEKGIPDILVSNRHELVKTDMNGKYRLPVNQEDDIVFVIKPAGYVFPLNEKNLPQFYYIYKPKGSPELKYPGIPPTGKLPDALNFPLYSTCITDTFDVIVLADPQPLIGKELNYVRDDIVAELAGIKSLFGIVLGDIVWDNLSLYDHYNTIMSILDSPFYYAPGNHDFNYDPLTNHHSLDTYNHFYGPEYYAFEYGKVCFMILNSVGWIEDQQDQSRNNYIGRIDKQQLRWIKNYLQYVPDDRLIVIAMHIPFYSFAEPGERSNVTNRDEFFELLKERKHLLAINGHLHKTENLYLDENVGWTSDYPFHLISCTTASGALWRGPKDTRGIPVAYQSDGTPNGYHLFHFCGNDYSQLYKAANEDKDYQIRISSPAGIIMKNELDSVSVTANFFNGNENSMVVCQVDQGKPVVMNRTVMKDPFMVEHMAEYGDTYYDWEKPAESIHIWTSGLPLDLTAGIHKIIVSATDQYGNEYKEISLFEIK